MKSMSNVDIYTICQELNDLLVGARVDKSFQPTKDTVVMRFHKAGVGRLDLVIQAGKRIHISQYPLTNPQNPPSFPMLLRKRLKGANVVSVKQHNFDRVVEIKMKKEETYTLIVELFAKGNIILLNEANEIILPLKRKHWSDRDISSKKEYLFPQEHGINPITLTIEEFKEIISNGEDEEIVRILAKNGLGSLYAEEIMLVAEITKKTNCSNLSGEEIVTIFNALKTVFEPLEEKKFSPMIVNNKEEVEKLQEENPDKKYKAKEDVISINIKQYEGFDKESFKSFNEACDEFYSSKVKNEITDIQESAWNKKVNKFSKRLEKQEETLKNFKKTIEDSQKKGELLFTNYVQIENILNVIKDAREKDYGWKEIGQRLKDAKKSGMEDLQIFESMDPLGNISLKIDDAIIRLDSKKSIPDNAEVYYEKAKKAKRKIKGALIAIENTKHQLADMEAKKEKAMLNIMVPQKRIKKNLKWYEKLRWFVSTEGILVVCGRDATTNEGVVKKYLEQNDVYLHADIHGAPSVVAKVQSDKLNDNLLKELGEFSAAFSSAWSKNFTSQDVYWVEPEQVSKTPVSGEFVPKGAFIIRGHRNYIRGCKLEISIGLVDYDGEKRIMAGPTDAMKTHTSKFVTIKPGYTKKEKIAKEILSRINEDNKLSLDDVVRVLPSGKCDFI
ncbi:ribosome rescue protein RqcH [Methanobrevibacter olleyae]|uniref:Archaeal Rqc2 homolog aRqcH n=1 Tax=Methanobrevibacter olleyae TaxID=294671 RepID=A0A126QYV9_METOL|nr:ribosome rescue protein RqcH [Methanobrevibacter olleyae]AMK14984.1 fibronectin-binding A domain-containing protein [Methanobrevibacter olleyae]